MDLSIIIINYFTSGDIKRLIHNLTLNYLRYEIVIVNNSNTLRENIILEELKKLSDHIKIIYSKENLGFAKGCNLALEYCKSEYILLLNPDIIVMENSIEKLLEVFHKNRKNNIGTLAPKIYWNRKKSLLLPLLHINSPLWEIKNILAFKFKLFREWFSSKEFYLNKRVLLSQNELVECDMVSGGFLLTKKSVIDSVGGLFDERFFMYFEDCDFNYRLKKKGFKRYVFTGSEAIHLWKDNKKKREFQEKYKRVFYQKHFRRYLTFFDFIKRVLMQFPNRVGDFKDLGSINSFQIIHRLALAESDIIEIAFHYSFVPSILEGSIIDYKHLDEYLERGREYWIRVWKKGIQEASVYRCFFE